MADDAKELKMILARTAELTGKRDRLRKEVSSYPARFDDVEKFARHDPLTDPENGRRVKASSEAACWLEKFFGAAGPEWIQRVN